MRVSVVIPCHNSLRFLPETLDSVVSQDLPAGVVDDYEVVLVDDGGTDDLEAWTAEWAAARSEARVRVVRQANAGVSAARNRGIAESKGDLIAFCDSDDVWTPTTVAALVGCFVRDRRIGLAYGWYDVIDADGQPTGRVSRSTSSGRIWEQLVLDNPIAASGVMVRREVFDALGGFAVNRERFPIDVEDWELWIRISEVWPVGLAPRVVVHHRRHDSNSSTDVESIDAAYRHLLDVVFSAASEDQRRLLPLATANIEIRLASHWINDRQDAARGLDHLARAASLAPEVRRRAEFWRLRVSGTALRVAGDRGHTVLRSTNRVLRLLSRRARALRD